MNAGCDNCAVVLCFTTSDRAYLLSLAAACARGREVIPALPIHVVLECGIVVLEDGGEVVPESWGELGGWVGERWGDEGAVFGFCRIVFGPYWSGCLIVGVGEVGDVGDYVENPVCYWVDGINSESWMSARWCH